MRTPYPNSLRPSVAAKNTQKFNRALSRLISTIITSDNGMHQHALLFLIAPAPRGFNENGLVRPAEPNQPIFQTEGKNAATGPTRAASPKADAVDTNEAGAPAPH